jgi:hypothetical protein
MSEEKQRTLREAGHRPAEAEKEHSAQTGREALRRRESQRAGEGPRSPDEPTPQAEDRPDKPRPRR